MSAEEFQRWKVLERIDPWGERREDWRIALLASQVAGLAGAKKSKVAALPAADTFKAIDCILEFNMELPEVEEDIDPIDAEAAQQKRAAEIQGQVLRMFGFGAKQVAKKKIIQEHDKGA